MLSILLTSRDLLVMFVSWVVAGGRPVLVVVAVVTVAEVGRVVAMVGGR